MTIGARSRVWRIGALVILSIAAFASPQLVAQQSAPAASAAKPVFVDGQAQIVPAFEDQTAVDSPDAVGRDRVRFRRRRQARSHVRRRHAPETDRDRRAQSSGHLRVVAVLRGNVWQSAVSLGRETGSRWPSRRRGPLKPPFPSNRCARTSRARSSRRGCRAASPSCTRMRPVPGCRRDVSRSAPIRSSSRRRRSSTG